MSAKVTVETPDGNKMEFMHACGLTFTWNSSKIPHQNLVKHVGEIENLEIRDDDIYLATFPKCGTHWTWEILVMLQRGTAEYETKVKESAFLDLTEASKIDQLPSPRVLNSHYPPRLLPKGIVGKGTKIIHVMRNPKDAFVSMYYHHKAIRGGTDFVKDFKTFLSFARGDYGLPYFVPFFQYIKEWESFTEEHPNQILNIYYEDMKEDIIREIKKIDKFLGTNRDDELIKQIADACHFHNLKKADAELKVKSDVMKNLQKSFMYRKGEVGDWKNHYTVSMNEYMDKWIEEKSRGSKTVFRYTV